MGKGASLGKEAVLADSGRGGEKSDFFSIVLEGEWVWHQSHGLQREIEEGPMQCVRCDDLMVADNLIDMQESSIPMWMRGWRCVSCWNIIDPLVQKHRMIQQAGALRLLGTEMAMPRLRHALKAIA